MAPNLAHALLRNRNPGSNKHVPAPDSHPNTLEKHLHLEILDRKCMPMNPRGNHHLQDKGIEQFSHLTSPSRSKAGCTHGPTPQPRPRVPPTNTYGQGEGGLRLNPTRTLHRIRISDATPTPRNAAGESATGRGGLGAPIRGVLPRSRGITAPETPTHERNRTGTHEQGRARVSLPDGARMRSGRARSRR